MPEYLKLRFGGERIRVFLAIIQLTMNLFAHITGEMYAGILIIQIVLGWNIYASVITLLILTAIFTVAGGLTAVMHTDALQAIIILLSAAVLMVFSWIEIGDYFTFEGRYMDAIPDTTVAGNTTCGIPTADAWHIFRPVDAALPWPGVLFGIMILSTYYFCTNQVLVQRCLAAKDISHSKGGTILAGYLKILPMFLMVWPGMISRILYPDIVACVDSDVCNEACGNAAGCSNVAYPLLILGLMPIALKGLMLAAMLAGVMSSFTSIFNSTSSIFTIDIWKRIRPKASTREEMVVGRVFVLFMVTASILWLPVLEAFGAGQLFVYLQSVTSYIAPPTLSCFLLAIGWERTNEQGAFWGLIGGFIIGGTRMILDFVYESPGCDEPDTRPGLLANFHYLHFAIFLFLASMLITILISLFTKPQRKEELYRLTWWTRHSTEPRAEHEIDIKRKTEKPVSMVDVATCTDEDVVEPENKDTKPSEEIEDSEKDVKQVDVHEDRDTWTSFKLWASNWICGATSQTSEKEQQIREERAISLEEDPKWARIVNINGAILLVVGGFVWGFFG
ncbi:sodium/glucose cotransporter 4-like isoform X2 [Ptychodera flava]